VVILYQRFGTTYLYHLKDVVPKRRYRITTLCCVKSQKSAVLIYTAAED
jgi:hypothetical protein